MNATKARKLRKAVYGNGSKRNDAGYVRLPHGQIVCAPKTKRAIYQKWKREEMRGCRRESNDTGSRSH